MFLKMSTLVMTSNGCQIICTIFLFKKKTHTHFIYFPVLCKSHDQLQKAQPLDAPVRSF